MPVVKTDVEAVQIALAASRNNGHELLRLVGCFFSRNHDRRAVQSSAPTKRTAFNDCGRI